MPDVNEDSLDEKAIDAFAYYTKEGYENVTGIAKGNKKWDKFKREDRDMTDAEIKKGNETLEGLKSNWEKMPSYEGDTVYRVIHTGTGEDKFKENEEWEKMNPTSTSVSIDWSRVGEGKKACKIIILEGKIRPVDTRAVSTYTHEAEILLPPQTKFKKLKMDGEYQVFSAQMP
jgi:hypothetical protein